MVVMVTFLDAMGGITAQEHQTVRIGVMGIVCLAPQGRIAPVARDMIAFLIQQMRFHALPASTAGQHFRHA
jgi:hypothetical protein